MFVVILFSSSRENGHTKKAVQEIFLEHKLPIIDLQNKNISFFDYNSKNRHDDFIPLVEELVKFKTLIFASPTYWYSMCAQMKTFFDRISDLYSFRKDLIKELENKNIFVITSYGSSKSTSFEAPFKLTSDYLKMNYHCCHYDYSGENKELRSLNKKNRDKFLAKVKLNHSN